MQTLKNVLARIWQFIKNALARVKPDSGKDEESKP